MIQWEFSTAPMWAKVLVAYLLVGWCTQLPGALFYRRYVPRHLIREGYERRGARILLETPIGWLLFTVLLWPVPFVRAGLNVVALALILVGVVCSVALITYVTTLLQALVAVAIATSVSLLLARPRGR